MKIYDINNILILDTEVNDDSYQSDAIMSEDNLYLYYSLQEPIDLPLHSYCEFNGRKYTLMDEENFTKINTENHEYKVTFESYIGYLKRCKFEYFTLAVNGEINSDIEIDFSLTLKPSGFARLLVDNMNQKDESGGWLVGECVEADEKLLDFSDMFCIDALTYIAEQFSTEWEIENKTIHIRKVEREKDNPLALAYGQGQGILSGLERTNYKSRIGAVRVKTSDRNTNRSTYGSSTLKMPKKHTVVFNGVEYVTDASGSRLMRKTPLFKSPIIPEETLDLTNIYPKRIGTISSVIKVDTSKNLYDIIDIDNEIDFSKSIIPGETMTLIFQGGQLSGREFDVTYIHEDKRFEIAPLTDRGMAYPVPGIEPEIGGKYAVFHISLPQEYITDAELEVLDHALKFLVENELPHFSYKATLDKIFAKEKWQDIGYYFNPGYFIRLTEPQYLKEPADIRIVSVKRYINNPYMPEITLSNSVSGKTFGSSINQLPNQEQKIERSKQEALSLTKRRFRDMLEMGEMLEKAIGGFSASINPITVSTMQLRVGSEQLQFRFVDSKINPQEIIPNFLMNNTNKTFSAPACVLQHMTLGIDVISSSHTPSEYKYWDIAFLSNRYIGDDKSPYYLYARCSKHSTSGNFLLSKTSYTMEGNDDFYYFLVGTIGSEWESERSFETCYGFTEILPGRITTNLIKSPNGDTYFNIAEGEIGGNIRIKAGSGYMNLSDRPDLSIYATYSDFGVLSDRIYANVSRIDKINNTIASAGWITTADGNYLYARKDNIISTINQSPEAITIKASLINLTGRVSFSSLDPSLQDRILSKVSSSDLGGLAYKDKVEQAMKDETLIVGGYIKTSLIRVDEIFANAATIGNFIIKKGTLQWSGVNDGASVVLGYNYEFNRNNCVSVKAGFFGNGIAAINATGGAAIFASMYESPVYPGGNYLYAIYVDGDIVVTRGNIIVSSGGKSGKGAVQADEVLPQNGFSGSMKGKSMEFKNGILINAW